MQSNLKAIQVYRVGGWCFRLNWTNSTTSWVIPISSRYILAGRSPTSHRREVGFQAYVGICLAAAIGAAQSDYSIISRGWCTSGCATASMHHSSCYVVKLVTPLHNAARQTLTYIGLKPDLPPAAGRAPPN